MIMTILLLKPNLGLVFLVQGSPQQDAIALDWSLRDEKAVRRVSRFSTFSFGADKLCSGVTVTIAPYLEDASAPSSRL